MPILVLQWLKNHLCDSILRNTIYKTVRNYLKIVTPSTSSGQALSEAKGLGGRNKIFFPFGFAQAKGFLRSEWQIVF